MDTIFENIITKLESFFFIHSPSSTNDIDGVEAIGMLTSLTQFIESYKTEKNDNNNNSDTIKLDNKKDIAINKNSTNNNDLKFDRNNDVLVNKIYTNLNNSLNNRINIFINEQIHWLNNQKGDPKAPEVLSPFARFPYFILQVLEMANGMVISITDIFNRSTLISLHKFIQRSLFTYL